MDTYITWGIGCVYLLLLTFYSPLYRNNISSSTSNSLVAYRGPASTSVVKVRLFSVYTTPITAMVGVH